MNDPRMDPNEVIAPSHDNSLVVSGPVLRGVSSESNNGKAGDKNPAFTPCARIMQFALKNKIKCN